MNAGLVRVVLSTYNSERFLRPLLESVLGQTHAPLELWVRDDGSRDATPAILREYADRYPARVKITLGANVGFVQGFFAVAEAAGTEAEFTAFCDHDDVWHPTKIERAVEMLRSCDAATPVMYAGRLHIVDVQLRHLGYSAVPGRPMAFSNALVENVSAGCTMVMNRPARDLLLASRSTSGVFLHDWWFYLLVSAFGTVLYDERALIDYRRHDSNVVGSPTRWTRQWLADALGQLRGGTLDRRLRAQAAALRREYGARMPAPNRAILDAFLDRPASLIGRVRHALTCPVYRQRPIDGAIVRFAMVTATDE